LWFHRGSADAAKLRVAGVRPRPPSCRRRCLCCTTMSKDTAIEVSLSSLSSGKAPRVRWRAFIDAPRPKPLAHLRLVVDPHHRDRPHFGPAHMAALAIFMGVRHRGRVRRRGGMLVGRARPGMARPGGHRDGWGPCPFSGGPPGSHPASSLESSAGCGIAQPPATLAPP
jgi:hypothetical protein